MLIDLVPVASWLALRGRCRYCRARVNARYPLVELACAVLFSCMVYYTPSLSAIPLAFLAFLLLCVTIVDIDTREIPDGLLTAGAVAGILWVASARFAPALFPFAPLWYDALLGTLTGALTLLLIDKLSLLVFKRKGMGCGDVKLMAMAGMFLGWQPVIIAFFLAFISAGGVALYLLLGRKAKRGDYLPFAPFLCGGSLVALWFGQYIVRILGIG
jgi:leader peptidase (prepilin peptidase)/N-methyltransferase